MWKPLSQTSKFANSRSGFCLIELWSQTVTHLSFGPALAAYAAGNLTPFFLPWPAEHPLACQCEACGARAAIAAAGSRPKSHSDSDGGRRGAPCREGGTGGSDRSGPEGSALAVAGSDHSSASSSLELDRAPRNSSQGALIPTFIPSSNPEHQLQSNLNNLVFLEKLRRGTFHFRRRASKKTGFFKP